MVGIEECDDGNTVDFDGCSGTYGGKIETWLDCSEGECTDSKAPEATLDYIGLLGTNVNVQFCTLFVQCTL